MTPPTILDIAKRTLQLDEKATKGPWTKGTVHLHSLYAGRSYIGEMRQHDDCHFIAHSRTAAPVLARAVVELCEALDARPHDPKCNTFKCYFSDARRAEQERIGCDCWKGRLLARVEAIAKEGQS